jgi:hypothetical protein
MMNKFTTIWLKRELVEQLREIKNQLKSKSNRKEATWSDVIEYLLERAKKSF